MKIVTYLHITLLMFKDKVFIHKNTKKMTNRNVIISYIALTLGHTHTQDTVENYWAVPSFTKRGFNCNQHQMQQSPLSCEIAVMF